MSAEKEDAARGLAGRLAAAAASYGEVPYLIWYDSEGERQEFSYRAFMTHCLRIATLLEDLGVGVGDRVATVSCNRPEVLAGYFACWLLGAVACPVNVEESPARKDFILRHARCSVALVEAPFFEEMTSLQKDLEELEQLLAIEELFAETSSLALVAPRSLKSTAGAFLVYTSGTTGDPKGVLLNQGNLLANAEATAEWHDLAPGQGVMTVLPIHHVNGAIVTGLTPFLAGARNILNHAFSPQTFWRRLAVERAALASMVPTLLEFLLSADEDIAGLELSRLRYLLCGAGPLLCETVVRFEDRFGVAICHGFGMSETTAYNTQFPMRLSAAERRYWYTVHGYPSVGNEIACNRVAILREDGSPADRLERGEIAVRGPTVMTGYLGDRRANECAFIDGWFLSGDQGFFDVDGAGRVMLFISGRKKELIVRGGVNISPLEIDEVLRSYPGVAFALALPFENTFYGEEVAAYVVPESGRILEGGELLAFARKRLPFARAPKVVVIGHEVPFTATGKPKRLELAERLAPVLTAYRTVQFRPP